MSEPIEDTQNVEEVKENLERLNISRMYIVVRQDLNAGYQLPQAIHAKDEFTHIYPKVEEKWYKESNTLVVLGVADENELLLLDDAVRELDLKVALFYEPDIDAYTALAIEPGERSAELLRDLRPAGTGSGKKKRRRRRGRQS